MTTPRSIRNQPQVSAELHRRLAQYAATPEAEADVRKLVKQSDSGRRVPGACFCPCGVVHASVVCGGNAATTVRLRVPRIGEVDLPLCMRCAFAV